MKKYLFYLIFLVTITTFSQKIEIIEGDIKNLKNIGQFNLEFDYSNIEVVNFESEEEFLKVKAALREEKEKGKGEAFKNKWFEDRNKYYHPKFIESFNKRFRKEKVKVFEVNEVAKYIMKIHTTKIYPGYNVGVWHEKSVLEAEIIVYAKNEPNKILFRGKYKNVGGFKSMQAETRISGCYARLAKNIAFYIQNKAK